jgi:MarR family transcriptional regulator for hemolysin
MSGIIKKISAGARNRTTYAIGLLQAKAYRILKQHTTKALSKYEISTVEWAFLGLLYENKDGLRSIEVAHELGVKPPFITSILNNFDKKHLVDISDDSKDSRAKVLRLTKEGNKFVDEVESYLKDKMRPLIGGAPLGDILSYILVLEKIIENSEKNS